MLLFFSYQIQGVSNGQEICKMMILSLSTSIENTIFKSTLDIIVVIVHPLSKPVEVETINEHSIVLIGVVMLIIKMYKHIGWNYLQCTIKWHHQCDFLD